MKITATIVLLTFIPFVAKAQDGGTQEDTPVAKDGKVPFTGILLSTDSYSKIIKDRAEQDKLKIVADTLKEQLKLHDEMNAKLLDNMTKQSDAWKKQAEENAKRSWWDETKFQFGVVIGVILTIGVTFAVAQAIKTPAAAGGNP